MSDKHTDAQGEVPTWRSRNTPENVYPLQELMQQEIDALRAALARRASQVSAAAPADVDDLAMLVRKLVRALKNVNPDSDLVTRATDYLQRKGLAGSPLRATEGQAQTSAATGFKLVPYEPTDEQWQAGIDEWNRVHGTTDGEDNLPNVIYRAMLAAAPEPDDDDQDAAQLADSTAPAAPVYFVRVEKQYGWKESTAEAYEYFTEDNRRILYAAPTAQQSLTDAGAVPDLPQLPEPLEIDWPELHSSALGCGVEDRNIHDRYEAAEYGWQDGVDKAIERVPDGLYDAGQMQDYAREAIKFAAAPLPQVQSEAPFDFHAHLARQAAWSEKTFGPGARTLGVCDHIRKELLEIEADPLDLKEWIDVVILALDGAWRCGGTPAQIIGGITAKQAKNEGRVWPDWRTMDPNKAIEHDRSKDQQPVTPSGALADNDGGVA